MTSLATLFQSRDPLAAAQTMHELIDTLPHEPGQPIVADDAFARAELLAASSLLARLGTKESSLSDEDRGRYWEQVAQHLDRSRDFGIRQVLTYPTPQERQAQLDASAPSLSLAPVIGEALVGALDWMRGDDSAAQALLASALAKTDAIARVRPAQPIHVDEVELVEVSRWGFHATEERRYQGLRPEAGSAPRLAQDLELALRRVRGEKPRLHDVYGKWMQVVPAEKPHR